MPYVPFCCSRPEPSEVIMCSTHQQLLILNTQNVFSIRYRPIEYLVVYRFLKFLYVSKYEDAGVIYLNVGVIFLDLERLNVFTIRYNLVSIVVF